LLVMPKAISVPACAGRHAAPARINRAEAIIARRFMVSPRFAAGAVSISAPLQHAFAAI